MKALNYFTTLALLLRTPVLYGHPGHGTFDGFHFMHYLTSPLHLILLLAVVAGAVYVWYRKSSRQNSK